MEIIMEKNAMQKISYGLYILTAKDGGRDNGCIINTVMQVTAEPERIAIAVSKSNYTHDMITRTGEFNISVLTQDSVFDTYRHWGFQSGGDTDKTEGFNFCRSDNGIIYVTNECNAFISAKVYSTVDLGSHTLFLADVTDGGTLGNEESVTYSYYHKNIKPAPKKAEKRGFICTICGYIYEGEALPEDYICPICKHPASDFVRLGEE